MALKKKDKDMLKGAGVLFAISVFMAGQYDKARATVMQALKGA